MRAYEVPKIWGTLGPRSIRMGGVAPETYATPRHVLWYQIESLYRSNRFSVFMEILEKILTPCVSPFKGQSRSFERIDRLPITSY